MRKTGCLLLLVLCAIPAHAEYSEECRALSERLAREPGTLKVGELDLLKNCLSGLQRGIVLGEAPPPPTPDKPLAVPECPPAEVPAAKPERECPACPVCAAAAVRRDPPPARERTPRDRDPASEDRRLKPFLPQF